MPVDEANSGENLQMTSSRSCEWVLLLAIQAGVSAAEAARAAPRRKAPPSASQARRRIRIEGMLRFIGEIKKADDLRPPRRVLSDIQPTFSSSPTSGTPDIEGTSDM